MIRVSDLLSLNEFKEFRLIAGREGLDKVVMNSGILEHEGDSILKIAEAFTTGDFVVTTLFFGKMDVTYAEKCLVQLIDLGVSAIAIKGIYFQDLSDGFKQYADIQRVPIFIFADTFIDDIIFSVKSSLIRMNLSDMNEKIAERIIRQERIGPDVRIMAREMNPLFFDHVMCVYCHLKESAMGEVLSELMRKMEYMGTLMSDPGKRIAYSFFRYREGIFLFYTTEGADLKVEYILKFLDEVGVSARNFIIGISDPHNSIEELGICMKKSIYAYISCRLEGKSILQFRETGADQMILPFRNDYWTREYYDRLSEILIRYDKEHESNLMGTAVHYIQSNYDIVLTSKITFQHSNTIRNKLSKIRRLLELEESDSFNEQLFVLIRLYLARNYYPDI